MPSSWWVRARALLLIPLTVLTLAACGQGDTTAPAGDNAAANGAADTAAQPAVPPEVADAFDEDGAKFVPAAKVAQAEDLGMEIVYVDARTALDYEFGHIPGAIHVPYFEPEQHLDALPRDQWIVTYCECPHAEAEQVADALLANGFTKVKVIDEGLAGWRDLNRPIVGGTPEASAPRR